MKIENNSLNTVNNGPNYQTSPNNSRFEPIPPEKPQRKDFHKTHLIAVATEVGLVALAALGLGTHIGGILLSIQCTPAVGLPVALIGAVALAMGFCSLPLIDFLPEALGRKPEDFYYSCAMDKYEKDMEAFRHKQGIIPNQYQEKRQDFARPSCIEELPPKVLHNYLLLNDRAPNYSYF